MRRQGFGKIAITWLIDYEWKGEKRIRVETLINNKSAINFWRNVGFSDYCLTLEKEN